MEYQIVLMGQMNLIVVNLALNYNVLRVLKEVSLSCSVQSQCINVVRMLSMQLYFFVSGCPPCYSFTQQCDRVIDCPVDGVDENETNCPSGPDIVYYFVPIIAVLLVIGCLVFALCKWNRTRKRTKTPLRTLNTAGLALNNFICS